MSVTLDGAMTSGMTSRTTLPSTSNYEDLECIESDQIKIATIISTIANCNYFTLMMKAMTLYKLGNELEPVHPLKFIACIFSNTTLKEGMKKIKTDSFKWNNFINPFIDKMNKQENLEAYIEGFAEEISTSQENITPFFVSRKWDELVLFLINN